MNTHWPLPETFHLRLTMLSDWHVGAGVGRPGNIDRLIVRDADGLPFVPAKTLRGIWRDACERLALGLDDGKVGGWCSLVDRVFGSQPALGGKDPTRRHEDPAMAPLESALAVRPARLADAVRGRTKADRRFLEAMTFIKPGVKIDRRSGQAETKFLRFEEMGRVGTVLEAECVLPASIAGERREAASALLIAGAQLVERLGGKRRRGPGQCRFEVLGAEASQAVTWLEAHEKPPAWNDEPNTETASAPGEAAPRSDPWVRVPLVLSLTGPLAVSYRTVGNVVETLDFLPGSYLLPHVTRTLKEDLGFDPRGAVQRGDLCVLPATLEIGGERGRPVPMALFSEKDNKIKIINRLLSGEPEGRQMKQLRDGYVKTRNPRGLHTVPRIVRTHNTVQDGPQRPTSDVGGVYTYEAIAPVDKSEPVRLRSELRLRKSLAEELVRQRKDWWSSLVGRVSLGRSKKDDYGEVTISTEAPEVFISTASGGPELKVWLLSDMLLRSESLRPVPTAEELAAELTRRLGLDPGSVKVRETKGGPEETNPLDELVRLRRLDTWHVGWGLPRPSLVAMQAGSCVVLTVEGPIDPSRLLDLEAGGIGERTAEGYGQICFNDPLLAAPTGLWEMAQGAKMNDQMKSATPPPALDAAHVEYARRLEREVWKQEIRRAALRIAADRIRRQEALKWDVKANKPPMSQLGALRGQIARLRGDADVPAILGWLNHLAGNPKREEKWPRGAITCIRGLIGEEERVWDMLQGADWPTLTEEAAASGQAAVRLRAQLWPLAVRTLFDACIRAHKRELEAAREVKHGA
jgi:CRISPR-associated protein Csx10